jgi:haloalkane dehalogenase
MCHGSRFSARQRARDLALVRVPLIRDDQLLSVVAILRKLSDEEMAEYRRPFAEPGEGRRPTLTWPRQIPIEGEPADVHAIATEYAEWLGTSNVPKLFLKAEPGAILTNDTLVNLVRGWPA